MCCETQTTEFLSKEKKENETFLTEVWSMEEVDTIAYVRLGYA